MRSALSIKADVEPNLWVDADPDLLNQVLQNLGSNATKYNREDGKIRLMANRKRDKIVTVVANTGKSIPEEDREKVFDRFYRADKSRHRKIDGVGLGLSLARDILRAHHGDLALHEAKQDWVAFLLTLPASTRRDDSTN